MDAGHFFPQGILNRARRAHEHPKKMQVSYAAFANSNAPKNATAVRQQLAHSRRHPARRRFAVARGLQFAIVFVHLP
jgi:hypothetical protein